MSKIVFFNIPAHGHTNPTIAVVDELVKRGNEVWYYSFSMFQDKIAKTGAKFIQCDDYLPEFTPDIEKKVGKDFAALIEMGADTTINLDEKVCKELKEFQPDCIVSDSICIWGKLYAKKLDIPFSFYIVSWLIGKNLPEGYLWGHTLINQIGYWGMYVNYICIFVAAILIINGWYNIYHKYWKMDGGTGTVVKTGVYKYIRHPQYTGFYLLTIGMIFEWATIPMLIMWPVIFVMYYRLAKKEEADMVEEFGDEYVEYRKRTKMFVPFVF